MDVTVQVKKSLATLLECSKNSKMKTVVLAACLLITVEVYAINYENGKLFSDNLAKCEEELGKSPIAPKELRPDVIHCALKKHGTINEQDVLDKNKSMADCDELVFGRTAVAQCKKIFSQCINIGFYYPGSNLEKSLSAIICAVFKGLMSLLLG